MTFSDVNLAPTFDFDAYSAILAEGEADPTWLSWAEFGTRVGAPRLLDLLKDRDWRVTWFVPGQTAEAFPQICERIAAEGHEIGHHGYCHEDPSTLSESEERAMLERGIDVITRLTGKPPRGYRAPFWRSSPRTQELLIEYGFAYDASLMGGDFSPYWYRGGDRVTAEPPFVEFGERSELVVVPVAWHLEDGGHYEIPSARGGPLRGPKELADIWDADYKAAHQAPSESVLTLTLHPEISGRGGRTGPLFELLDGWASAPDVGVVRLDEYVAEWRAAEDAA